MNAQFHLIDKCKHFQYLKCEFIKIIDLLVSVRSIAFVIIKMLSVSIFQNLMP